MKELFIGALKSAVSAAAGLIIALPIVDPLKFAIATLGGWSQMGKVLLIVILVAEARFWKQWADAVKGNKVIPALLLAATLGLSGCGVRAVRAPVWAGLTSEQIARGVYEKLTVFLKQAQANHPECSADQPTAGQGICPAIHDAIKAQNSLGLAINAYCAGAPLGTDPHYNAGGPCSPILGAESTLDVAISAAVGVIPVVRGAIQ